MAAQVFAFIVHKDGAVDDSALELISAARNIFPDASPTAILTGAGAGLDAACQEVAASYKQVWKFDQAALTYPNAELIRSLLIKVLPKGALLLLPHNTFGMDLGPGLAVKMDATCIPDVVGIGGLAGAIPHGRAPGIQRPGQHAPRLRCVERGGDQRAFRIV
jgi:electron transfer flavoprotein alpha subunit